MRPLSVRLSLWLVGVAARWVPHHEREEWLREWKGEVLGSWDARTDRNLGAQLDLVMRTAGVFRDAWSLGRGGAGMSGLRDDVVNAIRVTMRHPQYSAIVIVTLMFGIGMSTSMFAIAQDVLFRPFPYRDAERVVAVSSYSTDNGLSLGNVTYPNLSDLSEAVSGLDGIALARFWIPAHEGDDGARVVRGATVTANFFDVLGVEADIGRFFRTDEEGAGRPAVVVLSHPFWRDRFGGDPAVVGSTLRLSGTPYTVLGVTGSDFEDPWLLGGPGSEPQLWRTVASPPSEWPRSGRSWKGIGRLGADTPIEDAQAEIDIAFARLEAEYPDHNRNRGIRITPLREVLAGPARPLLLVLLGSTGLLLLIACSNLANLMLGRSLEREQEYGLHRALGASGGRVFARSVWETAVLAGIGGGLGVALASAVVRAARALGPLLPRPVTGEIDGTVTAVAVLTTMACGLMFGVAPAVHAVRSGEGLSGRFGSRALTAGRAGQNVRRALVIGQIALTCVLLVSSGLLARTFQRLGAVDLGLRTEGVAGVELHGSAWAGLAPEAAERLWHDVIAAVAATPGVESVGAIDYLPLGGSYSCDGVSRNDLPRPLSGEGPCAEVRVVLPGALETMGIELVRGRLLQRTDALDAPPVVVVDEALVGTLWPGEDPIGKDIQVHTRSHRVVGIVRDMQHFGPGEAQRPMLYLHGPQEGWNGIARGLALVYRTGQGPLSAEALRTAVHGVNPGIALGAIQGLDGLLDRSMAGPRFRAMLMLAFAGTALLLSTLGIVGALLFSVSRRTREIGIRLALGAPPSEVSQLVAREGTRMTLTGLALGLVGAWAAGGAIEAMLFGVSALDPLVYGSVITFIGVAAALASWLPARRAARIDPIRALAAE